MRGRRKPEVQQPAHLPECRRPLTAPAAHQQRGHDRSADCRNRGRFILYIAAVSTLARAPAPTNCPSSTPAMQTRQEHRLQEQRTRLAGMPALIQEHQHQDSSTAGDARHKGPTTAQ
eukprot:1214316-Rhodomonas_salina.1